MKLDDLKQHREQILEVAARHGATNVRVFGSVLRGDDRPDSDVDFLVDFPGGSTLQKLLGLADDLERLLGRRADVLTDRSIYWLLRRRILNEARPL